MLDRYAITLVTAPSVEPVSLKDAKAHLRIDADKDEEDKLVLATITAARRFAESYCSRSLVQQTFDLKLDCFPSAGVIDVPRPPLVSVTSIVYVDGGGATQTLSASAYQVDAASEPGRIYPAWGYWWPVVQYGRLNAITIRCVAGYAPSGTSTDYTENIPGEIKSALLMLVGHLYEHRESVSDQIRAISEQEVPLGMRWLLAPYRTALF